MPFGRCPSPRSCAASGWAGAETPVVVQVAKVLVAGRKGQRVCPLLVGSRESEFSLAVMHRRNDACGGNDLDGLRATHLP